MSDASERFIRKVARQPMAKAQQSVIVIDSSDDEEVPSKRIALDLDHQIPATITPIKPANPADALVKLLKQKQQRSIPSGITVTPHPSTANNGSHPSTKQKPAPMLPKMSEAFPLAIQRQLQMQQMPQLKPAPHVRVRKTPTPPQRNLTTPPAPLYAIPTPAAPSMPIISGVQSMAPSATPPLQLMATPPHMSAALNEPLMLAPNWLQTGLNPEFTVNRQHNYANAIVNNTKKRVMATTPSPKSSPVLSAPTPPMPTLVAAPTYTTGAFACPPSSLASAPAQKQKKRITPITTARQLPNAAWDPMYLDDMEVTPSTSANAKLNQMKSRPPPYPVKVATSVDLTGSLSPCSPKVSANQSSISPTTTAATDLTITKVRLNGSAEGTAADSVTPNSTGSPSAEKAATPEQQPLEADYEELIKTCREADPTPDMEKLINNKLLKYYYAVHPDFVKSRGFRKNIRTVIASIRAKPELVYINLKTIVEELNARRKSKAVVVTNEENTGSTGNKRTDEQIKKLNKALYVLKKRIAKLEQAEIDFEEDDDDSPFLQMERYKKRACDIYKKICDLTGESKNAVRLVKKPIQFDSTAYPKFNKTLQAYINRTKEFPDFVDVLSMLEHCNRQYNFGLKEFEMRTIAYSSFKEVGKLLQSRRKTDLYETVSHFTANSSDPAAEDPELQAKLNENQKFQHRIGEIIEKYAREQDMLVEKQKEIRKEKLNAQKNGNGCETENEEIKQEVVEENAKPNEASENAAADAKPAVDAESSTNKTAANTDESDESDETNNSDIEAEVEKLANGAISDDDSDTAEQVHVAEVASSNETNTKETSQAAVVAQSLTAQRTAPTNNKLAVGQALLNAVSLPASSPPPLSPLTATAATTTPKCDKLDELKKTVNNNNTREKTTAATNSYKGPSLSLKAPQSKMANYPSPTVPNGKHQLPNNQSTPPVTWPTLKIISVDTINENVMKDRNDSPHKSKLTNSPPRTSAEVAMHAFHMRTVQRMQGEIVISDEDA